MPYIITDGTNYCHRTKTQAVEISPDIEKATRFRNEETAQKLLARATKKLKGFVLKEVPSKDSASKKSAAKPARPAKKNAVSKPETAHAVEEVTTESKTEESTAVKPQTENKPQTERRSRRSHSRRRKSSNEPTVETVQTAAASTESEPEKAEKPVMQTSTPQPKDVSRQRKAEKPAANKEPISITELTARLYEDVKPVSVSKPEPKQQDVPHNEPDKTKTDSLETAKPKYPTKFTRRKNTVSTTWSIEDATSRIFDAEPIAIAKETVPTSAPLTEEPAVVTVADAFREPEEALTPAKPVELAVPVDVEPADASPVDLKPAVEVKPVVEVQPVVEVKPVVEVQPVVEVKPAAAKPVQKVQQTPTPAVSRQESVPVKTQEAPKTQETVSPAEEQPVKSEPNRRGSHGSRRSFRNARYEQPVQEAPVSNEENRDNEQHHTRSGRERRRSDDRRDNRRSSSRNHSPESTASRRRLFTQQERNLIYNRSEGHCGICGRFIPLEEYTIDHIIPLSKGGTNDLDNLQACCGFCNKAKDDSMGDEFFKRIERIYLYQAAQRLKKKQYKKLKKLIEEID